MYSQLREELDLAIETLIVTATKDACSRCPCIETLVRALRAEHKAWNEMCDIAMEERHARVEQNGQPDG